MQKHYGRLLNIQSVPSFPFIFGFRIEITTQFDQNFGTVIVGTGWEISDTIKQSNDLGIRIVQIYKTQKLKSGILGCFV